MMREICSVSLFLLLLTALMILQLKCRFRASAMSPGTNPEAWRSEFAVYEFLVIKLCTDDARGVVVLFYFCCYCFYFLGVF